VIQVKKILILIISISLIIVLSGCIKKLQSINSFEDCVNAGNPVMESYSRQCRANGEIFVEEIRSVLSIEEAFDIAENSECTEQGSLSDNYSYNNITKTWWINLDLEKQGCSPALLMKTQKPQKSTGDVLVLSLKFSFL